MMSRRAGLGIYRPIAIGPQLLGPKRPTCLILIAYMDFSLSTDSVWENGRLFVSVEISSQKPKLKLGEEISRRVESRFTCYRQSSGSIDPDVICDSDVIKISSLFVTWDS